MEEQVPRVVIGMDPHKRSVTIEVMTADESIVGGGRFDTSVEGYTTMLEHVAAWPDRVVGGDINGENDRENIRVIRAGHNPPPVCRTRCTRRCGLPAVARTNVARAQGSIC